MRTPFVINVCEKDRAKQQKLLKELGGVWIADGIIGAADLSGDAHFNDRDLGRALSENLGEFKTTINLYTGLTSFSDDFSVSTLSNGWANQDTPIVIINGRKPDKFDGKIKTIKSGLRRNTATRTKTFSFQFCNFDRLLMGSEIAGTNEFLIACAIKLRRFFGIHLTQIIRITERMLRNAKLSKSLLLDAANVLDDKFVAAAIKLAAHGFRSKRFKPRPLINGETVKFWYDSNLPLTDQRNGVVCGTVVRMDSKNAGMVHVNTKAGIIQYYYGDSGLYQVWPISK